MRGTVSVARALLPANSIHEHNKKIAATSFSLRVILN